MSAITIAAMAPQRLVSIGGTSRPKRSTNALIGDSVGVNSDSQISATATIGTANGMTKTPRAKRHEGTIFSSPTAIAVPSTTCAATPKPDSANIT